MLFDISCSTPERRIANYLVCVNALFMSVNESHRGRLDAVFRSKFAFPDVIARSQSVLERDEAIPSSHYQPAILVVVRWGCFVALRTDWLLAMT